MIEAVRRFGWHPMPEPPRGEDHVFELWMLRDLACNLGTVRRSGRRLVATRRPGPGQRPQGAVVCGRAPARQGPRLRPRWVTELALLLGEAGEVTEAMLVEEVGAGAVGESWPAADRRTADCPRPAGRAAMAAGGARPAPRWRN